MLPSQADLQSVETGCVTCCPVCHSPLGIYIVSVRGQHVEQIMPFPGRPTQTDSTGSQYGVTVQGHYHRLQVALRGAEPCTEGDLKVTNLLHGQILYYQVVYVICVISVYEAICLCSAPLCVPWEHIKSTTSTRHIVLSTAGWQAVIHPRHGLWVQLDTVPWKPDRGSHSTHGYRLRQQITLPWLHIIAIISTLGAVNMVNTLKV